MSGSGSFDSPVVSTPEKASGDMDSGSSPAAGKKLTVTEMAARRRKEAKEKRERENALSLSPSEGRGNSEEEGSENSIVQGAASAESDLKDSSVASSSRKPCANTLANNGEGCKIMSSSGWKCSKCSAVVYCSKECQLQHWNKVHRIECQSHLSPSSTPTSSKENAASTTTSDEDENKTVVASNAAPLLRDLSPSALSMETLLVKLNSLKQKFHDAMNKEQLQIAADLGKGELQTVIESLKEPARSQLLFDHYKIMHVLFMRLRENTVAERYIEMLLEVANHFTTLKSLPPNSRDPQTLVVDAKFAKINFLMATKQIDLLGPTFQDALLAGEKIKDVTTRSIATIRIIRVQALYFFNMKKIDDFEAAVNRIFGIFATGDYYYSENKEMLKYVDEFGAMSSEGLRLPNLAEKIWIKSLDLMKSKRATTTEKPSIDVDMITSIHILRLAVNMFQTGRKKEAIPLFQEALDLRKLYFKMEDKEIKEILQFLNAPLEIKESSSSSSPSSSSFDLEDKFAMLLKMKQFKTAFELATGDLLKFYQAKSDPAKSFYLCSLYPFIIDILTGNKKEEEASKYLELLLSSAEQYYNLTADFTTPEQYIQIVPNRPPEISDRNANLAFAKYAKCRMLNSVALQQYRNSIQDPSKVTEKSVREAEAALLKKLQTAETFGLEAVSLSQLTLPKGVTVPRSMHYPFYRLLGFIQGNLLKFSLADKNFSVAYDILANEKQQESEECVSLLLECQNIFSRQINNDTVKIAEKYSRLLYSLLKKVCKKLETVNKDAFKVEAKKLDATTENIGKFLLMNPSFEEKAKSIPFFEECLELRAKLYDDAHHFDIAKAHFILGDAYYQTNKFDKSLSSFQKAQQILVFSAEQEQSLQPFHICTERIHNIKFVKKIKSAASTIDDDDNKDDEDGDYNKLKALGDSFINANEFGRALLQYEKCLWILEPLCGKIFSLGANFVPSLGSIADFESLILVNGGTVFKPDPSVGMPPSSSPKGAQQAKGKIESFHPQYPPGVPLLTMRPTDQQKLTHIVLTPLPEKDARDYFLRRREYDEEVKKAEAGGVKVVDEMWIRSNTSANSLDIIKAGGGNDLKKSLDQRKAFTQHLKWMIRLLKEKTEMEAFLCLSFSFNKFGPVEEDEDDEDSLGGGSSDASTQFTEGVLSAANIPISSARIHNKIKHANISEILDEAGFDIFK